MKEIVVSQGEYKTAKIPNIIDSDGIGPCIVVGAIHKNKGYMVHMVSYDEIYLLDSLLTDLKRDVKNKRFLDIYVAGGGLEYKEDQDHNEEILNDRKLTLEIIADAGFAKSIRKVMWNTLNNTQSLKLFIKEKRAEYNNTPEESEE